MIKKLIVGLLLSTFCTIAFSQATVTNPCAINVPRSSVKVAMSTATTTEMVPLVANQIVYICEFSLTISQVVTTANTIKFVYGTGSACGTGTTDLSGAYGTGGITAGIPITVSGGGFKAPSSNAVCLTTTIGGSGFFHGIISYIQQ